MTKINNIVVDREVEVMRGSSVSSYRGSDSDNSFPKAVIVEVTVSSAV